ncbi:MAG: hypothetical protein JWM88_2057 [Verrucomicrobia bacterium]|nr:hypothetical protein [Verrucomicrobiota bacterium]
MSQTIVSPPLSLILRRAVVRMWHDPDSRSVLIGIAGMLLVHLLLYLLMPLLLKTEPIRALQRPHAKPQQFSIELAPESPLTKRPPPRPPTKFVETNPDAPENIPDKTENFAAQNQQVAQQKPTPNGKSDHPAIEGQKEIHSNQIVSGQLTKPVEQVAVPPVPQDQPPQESRVMTTRPEQNPLAGFEKKTGDDQAGYGSNIAKLTDNSKNIPEKIDGAKDVPLVEGATAMQPQIDPHRPRPRPQIVKQQQTRPAIFEENKFGTSNIGLMAIDAKWSNYGAYLQRMIETVQTQFDKLVAESRIYPPAGSTVTIKFIMDSEGKIATVVSVDNKATEAAARVCINSITARSPYGPWTDDMKAVLGEQQEMTFSFYYQ